MDRVALHFERTDGRRGRGGDLLLRLGAWRQVCDSYYLSVDDAPTARGDLTRRIARLLEQWEEQVAGIPGRAGGTAFLPFDFSDQYTGWLRVASEDGVRARVEAGWSRVLEGWSFPPSDIAGAAGSVRDFDPVAGARLDCSVSGLLAAITAVRRGFAPDQG
ncbi:hypothetical protein HYE82_04975 [Streptomyces sp. BR123]|jgi:hypothetical protein|uniref:hypothetical protein n=1 Tax=Streptomyces sp. BR123 TaxID=2749828 RepID=UPI0015C41A8A|nr:hypothetical protein [Streptomyces sp. BR123]NXY93760.1 hypothetical protein [Streptomyces sp. BR123]